LGKPLNCGDTHFIDDFNQEFSRDVEPMRGGHEDAYYYQLVANVRRFKGARAVAAASPAKHLASLSGAAFSDVGPDYFDDIGDVTHRSALGYAGPQKYENNTGRNDLELARVARDADALYFYVKAHAALSPSTDERWLTLWLDTDGDATTGCAGFDYAVNRTRTATTASVEHCKGADFTWEHVGDAQLVVASNELVVQVPRAALQLPVSDGALSFRFKWTDNVPEPLEALDLLQLGDSAPNGRFTYRYSASVDIDPNQPPGEVGGAGGKSSSAGAASVGGGGTGQSGGAGSASMAGPGGMGGTGAMSPDPNSVGADGAGCACRVAAFAPAGRHRREAGLSFLAVLLFALARRRQHRGLC
jgi:hypothetical protein